MYTHVHCLTGTGEPGISWLERGEGWLGGGGGGWLGGEEDGLRRRWLSNGFIINYKIEHRGQNFGNFLSTLLQLTN